MSRPRPFPYLSYAGNGHLTGLADTRTPLAIAVTANALNVVLEVALVYGAHLSLPGVWVAPGLWLAARAALLGRRWRAQFSLAPGPGPG